MRKLCEGERVLLLERDGWEYVERKKGKEAVVVIALTEDGRVILTEQMRRPVEAAVIDFPAGLIGDEEGGSNDPKVVARKELEEETGYTCDRLELLARGPTSPGITSEIATFFRALGVRQVGAGGGVGGERIQVHGIRLAEMPRWLSSQQKKAKLIDLKIWSGLYFLAQST